MESKMRNVKGEPFTKTENKIVRLIAIGLTTKKIAELLNQSPRTTETHRDHIVKKSGCKGAKLIIFCHELAKKQDEFVKQNKGEKDVMKIKNNWMQYGMEL